MDVTGNLLVGVLAIVVATAAPALLFYFVRDRNVERTRRRLWDKE